MFDLTHDVKFTADMGQLVPTVWMDCVPGDSFSIGCDSLLRFAPLVAPMMHRVDTFMHYWFVPYRLLWQNWEKFITHSNSDTIPGGALPAHPYVTWDTSDALASGTRLGDYLGLPTGIVDGSPYNVNAFPFAAYLKIFNDYYRDQNLQTDIIPPGTFPLVDGDNTLNPYLTQLRYRAWKHDYFTSALPWAQKGDSVGLPLGTINIEGTGETLATAVNWNHNPLTDPNVTLTGSPSNVDVPADVDLSSTIPADKLWVRGQNFDIEGTAEATATSINDLRRAYALQRWLEKNARGGTRYAENILVQFGVKSSDARLQRAEYITGTKSPVIVSEVLNTTGTFDVGSGETGLPQGNMSGHGVSVTRGSYGRYFCEEHGCIIGIMSVMPLPAYQDGINRTWFKSIPYDDYYWQSFANIGEQEIKNKELYAGGVNTEETFGYIPRYSEYKYMPNRVAGDFRTSLAFWTLARQFGSAPGLNEAFIQCVPRKDIFAVNDPDVNSLYCQVLHKIRSSRPMPRFGTPMY